MVSRSGRANRIYVELNLLDNTQQGLNNLRRSMGEMGEGFRSFSLGMNRAFPQFSSIAVQSISQITNALSEGVRHLGSAINEASQFSNRALGAAGNLQALVGLSFGDALQLTNQINVDLAGFAADLPGETSDYVETANRISAPIAEALKAGGNFTVESFEENLIGLSRDLILSGQAVNANSDDVARFTRRFLGHGTISELRLLQLGETPLMNVIAEVLKERGVREDQFRELSSPEKLEILKEATQRANTPELVSHLTDSVSGIIEGFRSSIIDPYVGIFGLLRPVAEKENMTFLESFRGFLLSVRKLSETLGRVFDFSFDPIAPLISFTTAWTEFVYSISNYFRQPDLDLDQNFLAVGVNNLVKKYTERLSEFSPSNAGIVIGDLISSLDSSVRSFFANLDGFALGESIGTSISKLIQTGINTVTRNALRGGGFRTSGRIIRSLLSIITGIATGFLKQTFIAPREYMRTVWITLAESLGSVFKETIDGLRTALSNLVSTLSSPFKGVVKPFQALGRGVRRGANSFIERTGSGVRSIGSGIAESLGFKKPETPLTDTEVNTETNGESLIKPDADNNNELTPLLIPRIDSPDTKQSRNLTLNNQFVIEESGDPESTARKVVDYLNEMLINYESGQLA